jgi:hypothetical protein
MSGRPQLGACRCLHALDLLVNTTTSFSQLLTIGSKTPWLPQASTRAAELEHREASKTRCPVTQGSYTTVVVVKLVPGLARASAWELQPLLALMRASISPASFCYSGHHQPNLLLPDACATMERGCSNSEDMAVTASKVCFLVHMDVAKHCKVQRFPWDRR